MSARQFQLRTSELKLPAHIYDKYKDICDKCETCQKHKPAPTRSRISGLRATEFGDLVFIDHGSVKIDNLVFQFLILLDAATMFIQAYAVNSTGADESIAYVREFMDTYHCKPRTIVGDAGFQTDEWQTFYRKNGPNSFLLVGTHHGQTELRLQLGCSNDSLVSLLVQSKMILN